MGLQEHRRAIKLALTLTDDIGRIISLLGTRERPRGKILAAYNNAIRALRDNTDNPALVKETLEELRTSVNVHVRESIARSADMGINHAVDSLSIYGDKVVAINPNPIITRAHESVMSVLDSQIKAIQTSVELRSFSEAELLGDSSRVGLISHSSVLRSSAFWVEATVSAAYITTIKESSKKVYVKQAIAGIDERTTETCLMVNGQTQNMEDDFILLGTPRYADEQNMPGFHDYCRTTTALVLEEDADDDSTQEMIEAGKAELDARETRGLEEIHPASSISRR